MLWSLGKTIEAGPMEDARGIFHGGSTWTTTMFKVGEGPAHSVELHRLGCHQSTGLSAR
ncbi:MAG: hypothetical protein N838_08985 [Thiohalocapsa sp. PB-PSB1]|jgi:hypothetical protein|nr:MAG: hypothetical protein N838_01185 [Thiohalocapsa sp. PB-PSB1]QQO53473.1 MAG: hypothetical protein N838_08985 [Thiohalocapsa sp. PB-PSB1]